ncbi:DUF3600 domain-containing protein [Ureibacillus chungkukjangi]|uniref:Uncharacterized protein DUF3600 n=1 Tax=Ureibacillus chungkukjangi TaxID=1202712 RepID=A0A318TS31_9BACL|nr:DUF3600 domain-containing protein [Ureibacillus chungkukjangi]PYF04715.1 uncharacterized protein DUF3600 [Ureibacillus chungkukjangi]
MDNQIKEEIKKIVLPDEINERSKLGIQAAKNELAGSVKRFVKRKIAIAVLASCIIVPTGTFAYQSLLADDLYGSFDNVKKHVTNFTMENYLLFDAKLNKAKGNLGEEEYEKFKELLNIIISAKLDYGDKNGNINFSLVPKRETEEIEGVMYDIQPIFDKLNSLPSSRDLLTDEEYEQYIQALITYETTMALVGTSSTPEIDMIPTEVKDEYVKASEFLNYVNELQINN